MAKNLGPTFGQETVDAGLGGLPFSWGATSDDIYGRENLDTEQNTTLDEVIEAHNPTEQPLSVIPTDEFIARFTNQEYLGVCKQRATDIAANKVGYSKNWDVVVVSDQVNLAHQKVQKIKDDLVTAGVLTPTRADEIFS
jgi:hypothetical protein